MSPTSPVPGQGGWTPTARKRALWTVVAFALAAVVDVLSADIVTAKAVIHALGSGCLAGLLAVLGLTSAGVRKLVLVVGLVSTGLIGSSCAHAPDPLVTTGHALHFADDTFVETGHLMDAALDAHVVPLEQYRAWARFARGFPKAYNVAWSAWEKAVVVKDAFEQMAQLDAIAVLLAQLQRFYLEVTVAYLAPEDGGAP